MTQLTTHFSLEELTRSDTAVRLGIDNTPSDAILANLNVLAQGLEQVRALLNIFNRPVIISSGYRCPELNKALHGASNSAHMNGYAADFICPDFGTPLDIVKRIAASDLQFDQVIQEGTWVHISFDPKMRRDVLTAHFVNGVATYTNGV
jgi:hypothetical protein